MKIEKLDRVALNVKNADEARNLFSDLFGVKFEESPAGTIVKTIPKPLAGPVKETKYKKVYISPVGLELVETDPPCQTEGVLSFHLKVSDIEKAKAEMEKKGLHLLADIKHGGLREAIFNVRGARIILVQYKGSDAISAILQR